MTLSYMMNMQQARSGVNGCLGLFAILSGLFGFEYGPHISIDFGGAVTFGSWLLVGLFVVEGRMSNRTVCRHNLIFAPFWRVFEQVLIKTEADHAFLFPVLDGGICDHSQT